MLDQNFFEEKFARFSPLYKLPDKLMSRWICLDFVIVQWNLGLDTSLVAIWLRFLNPESALNHKTRFGYWY